MMTLGFVFCFMPHGLKIVDIILMTVYNLVIKSSRPTICCEAGSKAHLFARMYGMQCVEISSHNLSDKPVDMRS